MPNFDHWTPPTATRTWANGQSRPLSVGSLIADKPTTITVERLNGASVGAQVVRLDSLAAADAEQFGVAAVVSGKQKLLLLGYKNHPTIADTDLKQRDRVYVSADGVNYTVLAVEHQFNDRLLAVIEAM